MAAVTIGKTSEITIFFKGGTTLLFDDCELLPPDEPCDLPFTYVSRSTKKKKRALFCTSEIGGYSFALDFDCSIKGCENPAVDQESHQQPSVCAEHDPGR